MSFYQAFTIANLLIELDIMMVLTSSRTPSQYEIVSDSEEGQSKQQKQVLTELAFVVV